VVNVASIGAFLPTAGNATYAGTKAFLVTRTRALHRELRATGVRVQALCPGFTLDFLSQPSAAPQAALRACSYRVDGVIPSATVEG
jgi:short-subunit dehydrogenase